MDKKLTINIDIDGTYVKTGEAWLEWLQVEMGQYLFNRDLPLPYNLSRLFASSARAQKKDCMSFFENLNYFNLEVNKHADKVIKRLHKQGHKINFVSYVIPTEQNHFSSKRALIKYKFPFSEFIACENKGLIKGDVLIDDNTAYLNQTDFEVLRIQMKTNFQLGMEEVEKPFHVANDWLEVEKIINNYNNKRE